MKPFTPGPLSAGDIERGTIMQGNFVLYRLNPGVKAEERSEALNEQLFADATFYAASPYMFTACERSYIGFLCAEDRVHHQAEMCGLRDVIAMATGRDYQDVQSSYEEAALYIKHYQWSYEKAIRKARVVKEVV